MAARLAGILMILQAVHAQEVQLLEIEDDSAMDPQQSTGSWSAAQLESATEYCGCQGFSSSLVPGRTLYKPLLQDSRRAAVSSRSRSESGLELSMRFDDTAQIGFDQGPKARSTVAQYVDQISGSKVQGVHSKAALFRSPYSQLKLPTPIPVRSGKYTVSAWVRWPLGAIPENSHGIAVLSAGFQGDFQVAVNKNGKLGMSSLSFGVTAKSGSAEIGTDFIEDLGPKNATQVVRGTPVQPVDELVALELDFRNASNVTATDASIQQLRAQALRLKAHAVRMATRGPLHKVSRQEAAAARLQGRNNAPNEVCDTQCEEAKERVSKLEQGRGTNELLEKSSEYARRKHVGVIFKKNQKLEALRANETLKAQEVQNTEALVNALKDRQNQINAQIHVLSDEGVNIPTGLRLQNQTTQNELQQATGTLEYISEAKKNITDQIGAIENGTDVTPQAPPHPWTIPPADAWNNVTTPNFASSGFDMNWLNPGWYHLAAVADGSSTKFFINAEQVGSVPAVSHKDIYSFGNYQGGGFQWGAASNLEVHSKPVSRQTLREQLGCRIPLVSTAKVSSSPPGLGCMMSLSLWNKNSTPFCVDQEAEYNWIEVHTAKPQLVTAIAVAGAGAWLNPERDGNSTMEAGFVSEFMFSWSVDGKTWIDHPQGHLTGNKDLLSTNEVSLLNTPVEASYFKIWPKKWQANGAMRVELFGCEAATTEELSEISVKSVVGGPSVTALCGSGYAATGGGCSALNKPHTILWSAPEGRAGWRCEGKGNMKAMAICAPNSHTGLNVIAEAASGTNTIVREVSGRNNTRKLEVLPPDPSALPVAEAKCPAGKLVSGGCGVEGSGDPAQMSLPTNTSWICGGNSAPKKSFAICSAHPSLSNLTTHQSSSADDWVSLQCPHNTTLVGGGCQVLNPTGNTSFAYNGPDGKDTWTCGGGLTGKKIFVVCANVTLAASETEAPIPGARGKTKDNRITSTCECPVKCDCPTRNETGYITDPDFETQSARYRHPANARSKLTRTTGHVYGSFHFSADTHHIKHPRKIPTCMCPARAPTKVVLEFKMQAPSNVVKFENEVLESIDQAAQTSGQSCGCPGTDSCKCRIQVESISLRNGTQREWQWRGEMDRWKRLQVDTVGVHLRIGGTPETVVEDGTYNTLMSADAIGSKIAAAISDPVSHLRKQWFFMHIADASVVNKRLSKCDLRMTQWTYRDVQTDPKLDNGPSQWAASPENSACGAKKQSPIALGTGPQSEFSFWDTNKTADPSVTYSNAKEDRLQFDYGNSSAQVKNEGLFLKVAFSPAQTNKSLTFMEEGKSEQNGDGEFVLKRAVIHVPAEHTVKGVRHPMEIQYEHENAKGHLKIVSTLLQFGVPNPFLTKVFADSVPLRCTAGLETTVDPEELFPMEADYYVYSGSETKPPCKAAQWYVFKNPATVSLVQWVDVAKRLGTQKEYQEQCNRHGCTKVPKINQSKSPFSAVLKGNARPLQPLGPDRIVRASLEPDAK